MPLSLPRLVRRAGQPPPSRAVRAESVGRRAGSAGRRAGSAGRGRARVRRLVSALLAAAAVLAVGRLVVDRPVAGSEPVVVASALVAAGTPLSTAVVEVRHVPGDVIPQGAVRDLGSAVGRPAASVLAAGEMLTEHDVGAAGLLDGQGPGARAVFVPVPEQPVLATLRAGDRVDLHSPMDGAVVADDLLVLAVHGEGAGGRSPTFSGGPAAAGAGGVWVATDVTTAVDVAAGRGADPLGGGLLVSLRPDAPVPSGAGTGAGPTVPSPP